jgi:hypothetical protein
MNIEDYIQKYYEEYQKLSDKSRQIFDPLTKYINSTIITSVWCKGWKRWLCLRDKKVEIVPLNIEYFHRTSYSSNCVKVVVYLQKSYCYSERIVLSEEFTLKELSEDTTINQTKIYNFISQILKYSKNNLTDYGLRLKEGKTS